MGNDGYTCENCDWYDIEPGFCENERIFVESTDYCVYFEQRGCKHQYFIGVYYGCDIPSMKGAILEVSCFPGRTCYEIKR